VRIRTFEWANDFCVLKTRADPDRKKRQSQVIESMLGGSQYCKGALTLD